MSTLSFAFAVFLDFFFFFFFCLGVDVSSGRGCSESSGEASAEKVTGVETSETSVTGSSVYSGAEVESSSGLYAASICGL